MAFDVKKAVEGKTKEDLRKLMEMGLKKRALLKKSKNMTLPGHASSGSGAAIRQKPVPDQVKGTIGSINQVIGDKKGYYRDHINEHIREVKEYLASR